MHRNGCTPGALLLLAAVACVPSSAQAQVTFPNRPYGYQSTTNIVYGSGLINGGGSTLALTLDLFQPTDIGTPVPGAVPGVVLIHGGSFTSGNKSQLTTLAASYATYGFNVVSINYRLQGQNPPYEPGPYPEGTPIGHAINAAVSDSKQAIGWIRDNAALYRTDPHHVAIGGYSAGAITAEYEAYLNTDPRYTPQAVISLAGGMYGGREALIQPGGPPALLYHGDADTTVPIELELAVKNRLDALGIYNEMYIGVGFGHGLTGLSPPFPPSGTFFDLEFDGQTFRQHNVDFLTRFLITPEPSSFVLGVLGVLGLMLFACRRRVARRQVLQPH